MLWNILVTVAATLLLAAPASTPITFETYI